VLSAGHQPELVILESVGIADWQDAERHWIAYFKYIGANLTNSTLGGDGLNPTPEMSIKIAEAAKNPDKRAILSAKAKLRYSDPVERARLIGMAKAACSDPINRAKSSARMLLVMNTPERKLLSAKTLAAQRSDPFSKMNSQESKTKSANKRSVNALKNWSDPEYVAKTVAPLRTEEARKANSERMKKLHQDPAYIEHRRAVCQSPEYKQRISDAIKAHWVKRRELKDNLMNN